MEVSEIMARNPVVIESKEPIRVALDKLSSHDIRHLPVLRGGLLVGMLSERDVRGLTLFSEEERYETLLDRPTSSFMSSGVVTITENDDVSDAIDTFIEGKFGAIPVVDGHTNALVGILSYIDVLKAMRATIE